MVTPFEMNPALKAQLIFMTNRQEIPNPRQLACSACGTSFTCNPTGPCWCAEETARLPMPAEGADCLCAACLRNLAQTQTATRG
jgi:hypothetical protein